VGSVLDLSNHPIRRERLVETETDRTSSKKAASNGGTANEPAGEPTRSALTGAGRVSEKIHTHINGARQGMFIRGRDERKPVLLFLHGGPGMPEYFLDRTHPTGLEEDFAVCWWEQRGAGMSYRSDTSPKSMTVEQLIADTVAVTDFLRERFRKDKIYLMGHSWGSFLGIQVAQRFPDRYHAYIGMSQVSHQMESEVLSYQYVLGRFRDLGNTRMVQKLEKTPVIMGAPIPRAYMKLRDGVVHRLGVGTTRGMKSVLTGVFIPVWRTADYTMMEKVNVWRGKSFSRGLLWDTFVNTDLAAKVTELEIPAYFCSGRHDHTVSYTQTKTYVEKLRAQVKAFYTFEHSAHSPAFEEPDRMRQILRGDVLNGRTLLADGGDHSCPPT
jgi:pimeloyl-ACP methyl ester carboxylesterase